MSYVVTYIDNKRIFEGQKKFTTKTAKTEFQAINQLIQDDNRDVWKIIKVEKINTGE